jgi:hypothetical protein
MILSAPLMNVLGAQLTVGLLQLFFGVHTIGP